MKSVTSNGIDECGICGDMNWNIYEIGWMYWTRTMENYLKDRSVVNTQYNLGYYYLVI